MLFVLAALLLDAPRPAPAADPDRPAVTIRLVRPRAQGERLLALFEGARAPSPAAALTAYRRAKGGETGLGKPIEAAIASLNPGMIAELATLDDATFRLGWSPDGRLAWGAIVPHDDGTFAAYATAAVLTDGAADAPLDGLPVDRLGPKATASLAARAPGGFLLAGSRPALEAALRRSRERLPESEIGSGWLVHLDPKGLDAPGPLQARRAGIALARLGYRDVDASIRIEGEMLLADVVGRYATPPAVSRATIRPEWLDAVPSGGTLSAFAVALDPSPAAWGATFDLLDAVERADPERANVAPLRLRLNLLGAGIGLKPDLDLWPLLVGVSGFLTADGGLVRLHAKDEDSAKRLLDVTIPRFLRSVGPRDNLGRPVVLDPLAIGINGRAVKIERRSDVLVFHWGEGTLARSDRAVAEPSQSSGPRLRASLGPKSQRFAAVWPGRLSSIGLADAPPAVWVGSFEGDRSVDAIRWPGLKAIVHRVLDRLPFDPPPDRTTTTPRRD